MPPQRAPDLFPYNGVKSSGFGVQGMDEAILSMLRYKGRVVKN
jgi:glyceraldehyde-3-phosphate dehydrogenase (NADP+)